MNQTAKTAEPAHSVDPQLAADFSCRFKAVSSAKLSRNSKAGNWCRTLNLCISVNDEWNNFIVFEMGVYYFCNSLCDNFRFIYSSYDKIEKKGPLEWLARIEFQLV